MSEFGIVEDTMFIPMVGRIYATEKFPGILYDKKALSLKEKLPSALLETGNQSQYTLLASASRSANMDRHIQNFLKRNRMVLLYSWDADWRQRMIAMKWTNPMVCCRPSECNRIPAQFAPGT